jgi:hypothetical protein
MADLPMVDVLAAVQVQRASQVGHVPALEPTRPCSMRLILERDARIP